MKPTNWITGVLSVLILSIVFLTAIVVRVVLSGATFYEHYQKNSNSSQENPANVTTNRTLPVNNYNSYSNGNTYNSGSYNSANRYDANGTMSNNYSSGNTYTAPTPAPSMSNSYAGNTSNETEKPSATTSEFNGRIKADDIYIDALPTKEDPTPDSESQYLPRGTPIKIVCRVEKLIYRVNTRDGNTADINAYSIEFTTVDKNVPNCSSLNEKGSF